MLVERASDFRLEAHIKGQSTSQIIATSLGENSKDVS